jgi:hypothetical protein
MRIRLQRLSFPSPLSFHSLRDLCCVISSLVRQRASGSSRAANGPARAHSAVSSLVRTVSTERVRTRCGVLVRIVFVRRGQSSMRPCGALNEDSRGEISAAVIAVGSGRGLPITRLWSIKQAYMQDNEVISPHMIVPPCLSLTSPAPSLRVARPPPTTSLLSGWPDERRADHPPDRTRSRAHSGSCSSPAGNSARRRRRPRRATTPHTATRTPAPASARHELSARHQLHRQRRPRRHAGGHAQARERNRRRVRAHRGAEVPDHADRACADGPEGERESLARSATTAGQHRMDMRVHDGLTHPRASSLSPFSGGCLCGAVGLEIDRTTIADKGTQFCHCNSCRVWHAAPIVAEMLFSSTNGTTKIFLVQGADHLKYVETSQGQRRESHTDECQSCRDERRHTHSTAFCRTFQVPAARAAALAS